MIEKVLRLTPAQASRLDRLHAAGGYRTASELVTALVTALPDEPHDDVILPRK